MKNLAVLDFETNGGAGVSVLSASSLVFDETGVLLDVFNRFYLPIEPFDRSLTSVHGLTPSRLLALRRKIPAASLYFIEEWPDLVDFWTRWAVEGIVIHNARFDLAFLPKIARKVLPCWCSMRGLTDFCALPRRGGGFKYPKLGEALDILCAHFPPPAAAARAEEALADGLPHVSLADCFSLYRIMVRILAYRPELPRFVPLRLSAVPDPETRINAPSALPYRPRSDAFTVQVLEFDKRLREQIREGQSL